MRFAMHPRHAPTVAVVALAAVALTASVGRAGDVPEGPELGCRRYRASIEAVGAAVDGAVDVDRYQERLAAGERITIRVAVPRRGNLRPHAVLSGPDDAVAPAFSSSRDGRTLVLRDFEVPRTGVWVLTLTGANGTTGATGAYTLRTRVRAAEPLRVRGELLGGTAAESVLHAFEALDGASVRAVLDWGRGDDEAALRALRDPQGSEVPGAVDGAARRGRRRVVLSSAAAGGGDGTYGLEIGVGPGEASTCNLTLRVRSPKRSRRRVALEALHDPVLDAAAPVEGRESDIVRFIGAHLAGRDGAAPRVFLDGEPAFVWRVDRDAGTFVEVVVPALPVPDAPVTVTVVGADGQSTRHTDHFRFRAGGTPLIGLPQPDFRLRDVNPTSATLAAEVSPRDFGGLISAWYFGHAT